MASNPFDQFDSADGNPFDQFDAPKQQSSPWTPAKLPHSVDEAKSYALNLLRGNLRNVGLAGRTVVNAAAAPPLLAMDAGVAARNLMGGNYDLPSQTWNQGLDELGMVKPENITEKAADVVGQMAFGGRLPMPSAAQQAPANFIQNAKNLGYVTPPSQAKPTALNRILEGLAGKEKVQQSASAINQRVTDQAAQRAIGITDPMDMTAAGLAAKRAEYARAHAPLRGVGTMRADKQYVSDLAAITARFENAAKDFPKLARQEIIDAVDGMPKQSFDSDSAVDAISVLRETADDAFRAGNGTLGKAYKDMAKTLESAVERSLQRRGNEATEILKNFRDARTMIAKTHSVEKALNPATGHVDATKLAQQLGRKPLTGDLLKIAQFGKAFPKSSREITENIPAISPLDAYAAGGTALATESALPLLYPFTREALRTWMLSPSGQRMLTAPAGSVSAGPASSLVFGANAGRGLLGQ